MPELPEVETIARTLAPLILGRQFLQPRLCLQSTLYPASLPLESLVGLAVKGVKRRAKLLLLEITKPLQAAKATPDHLVFHLRMTGRLLTRPENAEPAKHTRCIFPMKAPDGSVFQLVFDDIRTFGKIFAATDAMLEKWPFWQKLGPEPLMLAFKDFESRLKGLKPIKNTLLDQRFIAGIGNIYADESLFYAGIHPLRSSGDLDASEKRRLLSSIKKVLKKAINAGGSSIRDYVDANGQIGAFQESFAVYGRSGEKCVYCGEVLKKIHIAGRSTVYCPYCQK